MSYSFFLNIREMNQLEAANLEDQNIFKFLNFPLPNDAQAPSQAFKTAVQKAVQNIRLYSYEHSPHRSFVLEEVMKTRHNFYLHIWHLKLTDSFFKYLSLAQNFSTLLFQQCQAGDLYGKYLGLLSLSKLKNQMTNRGFKQLAKLQLPNLQFLNIKGVSITIDGLQFMKYFTSSSLNGVYLQQYKGINSMVQFRLVCRSHQASKRSNFYFIDTIDQECLCVYLPHLAKVWLDENDWQEKTIVLNKKIGRQTIMSAPAVLKTLKNLTNIRFGIYK